jgi:hypothetical protein
MVLKKAYSGDYPEFFRDFITQNLLQGSNELAKFIILSKPGLSKFMDCCNLCWYYSVLLEYLAEYPAFWLSGLMVSPFMHPGQQ